MGRLDMPWTKVPSDITGPLLLRLETILPRGSFFDVESIFVGLGVMEVRRYVHKWLMMSRTL